MIRMVKGVYGRKVGGTIQPTTAQDGPFSLPPDEEQRLVQMGVAANVEGLQPMETGPKAAYGEDMKMAELLEVAKGYGLDTGRMRTKREVLKAIETYLEGLEDEDTDGEADEEAPPRPGAVEPT